MKHTPHSLKQTFRWLFFGLVVVALWLTPGLQASSNPEPVVAAQEAAPSCPPALQSDPKELQQAARQRETQRARVLLVGRKQELTAIVNLPDALTADKGQLDSLSEWNQKGNQPLQNGFVRLIQEIVSVEIDRTALKAKTAADESGTMLRQVQSDELVTTLKFQIAGAFQIRPCLSNVRLPKGTTIWTYAETGEPQGPVGIDLVTPDGDLWCPTIEGSTVWIEIHIPKAAFGGSAPFSFQLSKALETFRLTQKGVPLVESQHRGVFQPLDDSCLQDVNCVQQTQLISNASRGVGRMQYISGGSGFVCTGGLLNDQDPSGFIPYFLTANHCLSTQSEVSSLEVWWDYKTSTCNGSPPSSNSLQKSFGGTLLATSAGSDFTFIRLQSVPGNRIFLGWNAGTLESGVQLFRVHNPGGRVQHYSEHRTVTPTSTCQSLPPSAFLYSEDLVAATAGGSSGSPVLNSSEQVVGQLFGACGPDPENNCDRRNRTVDGRFSTTFPQIRQWLEGSGNGGDCTPTAISGNSFSTTDSITTSSCTVNYGSYHLPDTGEALGSRLSDLYSFSASIGERVTVTMGSTALDCALVLTMVQGEANMIVSGDDDSGPGTDSQVSYTINAAGTYRIYATSVGSTQTGAYSVTFSKQPAGGNCTPTAISGNSFSTTGSITSSSCVVNFGEYTLPDTSEPLGTNRLSQLYSFSGSNGEKVTITMGSTALDCALVLTIVSGNSNTIVAGDDDSGPGTDSQISFTLNSSGNYQIYATSVGSTQTGSFTINFSKQPASGGGCTPTAISGNSFSTTSSITSASCTVNFGDYTLPDSGEPLGSNRLSNLYSFSGAVGDRVTIAMGSATLDCALVLTIVQGESNTIVAGDDDSGPSVDSQLVFTLNTAGNYQIYAASVGNTQTGSYSFSFSRQTSGGTCTYSLSPGSREFSASGGSGQVSVTVTAGTNCTWTAQSNDSWIVLGNTGGTGNGSVNYTVQTNTSASSRTGTITIANQTHTVTQSGAAGCAFSISPSSRQFAQAGGAGSVSITVTAGTNCNWTAQTSDTWIVLGNTGGTGNGTVNYTVQANSTGSNRTGTIFVAGQTHTVSQTGGDTIPPTVNVVFPRTGDTISASTILTIGWVSTDNVGVTSQSIDLSTNGGSSFGITVATGLSGAATSFDFSVPSTLTTTTALIRVTARDAAGNQGSGMSGIFTIAQPVDTTPPTVSVTAPTGKKIKRGISFLTAWVSQDTGSGLASHDIQLSLDAGATFPFTLATGLSGSTQSINLTVPTSVPKSKTSRIRVIARDVAGNVGQGDSIVLKLK